MLDRFVHKWMKIPYSLNIRYLSKKDSAKATLLFIHGIGATGDMWQSVISQIPEDTQVNIVALDLLGFGDSPHPHWETYNARVQARSVLATFLKLRLKAPIIVVGHSLGTLVSVEFAKRYSLLTHTLILCSPPIYRDDRKKLLQQETLLRKAYEKAAQEPHALLKLSELAVSMKLLGQGFEVKSENIGTFISSLHASIINQTTIHDIGRIKKPIHILNGIFDPLTVRSNLKEISQKYDTITLTEINAAHLLSKLYAKKINKVIAEVIQEL